MPMKPPPPPGVIVTTTKDVTYPGWETEGERAEWFRIRDYIHPKTDKAFRQASTTTITKPGQQSVETVNTEQYAQLLFAAQLVDWWVLAPTVDDGSIEDFAERTFVHEGYRRWHFTERNVREVVGWDVAAWLAVEIQICGSDIASRDLVVKLDSGKEADFRGTPRGVAEGPVAGVLHPERDPSVRVVDGGRSLPRGAAGRAGRAGPPVDS